MAKIDLMDLWKAHPHDIHQERPLGMLKKTVIRHLLEARLLKGFSDNADFWCRFRDKNAVAMQDASRIRIDMRRAIDLIGAFCGSKTSMLALRDELEGFKDADPSYGLRASSWKDVVLKLDPSKLDMTKQFPAFQVIKNLFHDQVGEALAQLDQWNLDVVRPTFKPVKLEVLKPTDPVEQSVEEEAVEVPQHHQRVLLTQPVPNRNLGEEYTRVTRLMKPVPLALAPNPITIKEALEREFPWMIAMIANIITFLTLNHRKMDSVFFLPPMILVGEPGCGKTRFCHRLGQLLGISYDVMSLAGISDARTLMGTSQGYITAHPSFPLNVISRTGIANPLIVIDEIDKAQVGHSGGNVYSGLLNFLEPENARRFLDPYVSVNCDVSWVNWIATANDVSQLPKALRSRMTAIQVPNPTPEHFDAIIASLDPAGEIWSDSKEFLRLEFAKGRLSVRRLGQIVHAALAVSMPGIDSLSSLN